MNTNKWLWGELLAVLRRQSLLYDNPAKIQNMIRDIPTPPHFISFACVFLMSVKFQWLILEHQPCEWVCKCRFFFFGGFYEDQYEDQQWLCPNIPSYLDSTTAWCPSALRCYSLHFLWKSSLLLAALQTHSQQLHSNSNEQKTATLNVERTDTV